ncbi:MAG: transposase zinc-binding domain-containing protein [Elusimicrobia bacterium]|nr:transposase zinc-binding domain-containing protein [Elusimicrobiota bacterium]
MRRLVLDHLEEFCLRLKHSQDRRPSPHPSVSDHLRRFIECGVLRFGAVRYRCPDCGEDIFVAFSCKRRGLCPSCDAKATASHCT